jgi:hypothetical protein
MLFQVILRMDEMSSVPFLICRNWHLRQCHGLGFQCISSATIENLPASGRSSFFFLHREAMTAIERSLKLSASGMSNIPSSKLENDFTFRVGTTSYGCPWFVADFLSPRIGDIHSKFPSQTELRIETEDPEHQFTNVLSLGRGESVQINPNNSGFLLSIAGELANCELYWSLYESVEARIDVPTFCAHFRAPALANCLPDKAIEFLAVHFYQIEREFLDALPIAGLARILAHPSVTVETEDLLFEFISSHLDSNLDYLPLLDHVKFEFLTQSAITKFISWSERNFNHMNLSLWQALTRRLAQPVNVAVPEPNRYATKFCLQSGLPLDGIIAHLTRVHGGNVHDRGVVIVSASSVWNSSTPVRNAVELGERRTFESEMAPNEWVCYDFKDRRVELTDYSIANFSDAFLRSWIVEGSDDGSTWITLDERIHNTDADAGRPIVTFSVSRTIASRFIRLRQTGNNASDRDDIVLSGFEVFGSVIDRVL